MPKFTLGSEVTVAISTNVVADTLEEAIAVAGMRPLYIGDPANSVALGTKWVITHPVGELTAAITETDLPSEPEPNPQIEERPLDLKLAVDACYAAGQTGLTLGTDYDAGWRNVSMQYNEAFVTRHYGDLSKAYGNGRSGQPL